MLTAPLLKPARGLKLLPRFALLGALALLASCGRSENAAPATPKAPPLFAVIETEKGAIEIELLPNDAPKTVENFRLLTERGYFNGLKFHRIVKDFMLQTGDPLGTGKGGESAWGKPFDDEIQKSSPLYKLGAGYVRGIVAMANAGPNTNASQFFILQKDYPLPPNYTIFGRVIKGIEVVDALAETPTKRGFDGMMSQPLTPPIMQKVTIRKPAEPAGH
jgi:cyclophilin family peptidyl-prolyl cis-trans isomerase